jgi:hypothetical protein
MTSYPRLLTQWRGAVGFFADMTDPTDTKHPFAVPLSRGESARDNRDGDL